jgi:2-amino-4-hydroxy-6-hydroxymethyldihydropteridine diphosphokinase
MQTVFIAMGTNQGDREANIQKALELIKEIPDTQIDAQSDFKEYAPEDIGAGQADYLNGVIRVGTDLGPTDLLHKLQVIERRMGRSSKGDGASRPIDLDVLSFGSEVIIQGKTLTVPHPRLSTRLFVLEPLAQIAPDWKDPRTGETAAMLLEKIVPAARPADESTSQNQNPAQDIQSEARA